MRGNQRIALTKRLLGEALLRMMKHKPLDKINVSELCEEAGINRATFYRHYNIPRDVLEEMQSHFAEEIQSKFDVTKFLHSPGQYIELVCNDLYTHSDLVKIFISNNMAEDIFRLFDEFFSKLLRENKTLYKWHALDDNEVRLISAYASGGGYFMLRRWLMDGIDKSPKEITQLVLSFLKTEIS